MLSTKVGRYGADEFDFSAERVTRSVQARRFVSSLSLGAAHSRAQESLARLGVSYIDVIQCHDVEFASLEAVARHAIPALLQLKAAGVVRHIGLTGLPLPHLHRLLLACPPDSIDVLLSYCRLCLADDSLRTFAPSLRAAHGGGARLGLINASPLSMGLLTPRGPPAWHPAPSGLKAACAAAAAAVAALDGPDLPRVALGWAVTRPEADVTLVGMCTVAEVRANVATCMDAFRTAERAGGGQRSGEDEAFERALQAAKAVLDAYDGERLWRTGLEENWEETAR